MLFNGADKTQQQELGYFINEAENFKTDYYSEIGKIKEIIDKDIDDIRTSTITKLDTFLDNHKTSLKAQADTRNAEFLGLLQNSIETFKKEQNKMTGQHMGQSPNIILELSESWEKFHAFSEIGKNYVDKYSAFKNMMKENKSIQYYEALIKNFRGFEKILSFYDDMQKYPLSTDLKKQEEFSDKLIADMDDYLTNRKNYTDALIKLDKPPPTEEVVPEFEGEGYAQRHPIKVLTLVDLSECESIDSHKLQDITTLVVNLQAANVSAYDVRFVVRVHDFLRIANDLLLDLRGNRLNDDSIKKIAESISRVHGQLSLKLYLSDNQINDEGAVFQFEKLASLKHLRFLSIDLKTNKIYHKILPDIKKSLDCMKKLEELHMYLGHNFFLPSSKDDLKKSIKKLPKIKTIAIKL